MSGVHRRTSSPTPSPLVTPVNVNGIIGGMSGHGSGRGNGVHNHDYKPKFALSGSITHESSRSVPASYLTSILGYQAVFRLLGLAVYLIDVLWAYQRGSYHSYLAYAAYLTYWIPFHYAVILSLKGEKHYFSAVLVAMLSHILEAFVLISTVFNPKVWGAQNLKYLVWPTATQGIANALMAVMAYASALHRRARGQQMINLGDIAATALPVADAVFLLSLLMVPYVPIIADLPRHRAIGITAILNVVTLHLRYLTFTGSIRAIQYLPNHALFAAIAFGDAKTKGNEMRRKMDIDIPGLDENETPAFMNESDDSWFVQRVYLLHFARLGTTYLVWDAVVSTSITSVVAAHPYLALIGFGILYKAPVLLARLRLHPVIVSVSAMIALDALRGVTLASVGGLARWVINVLDFGVSTSEKEHVEAHTHLIILLALMALLGARAALALTFVSSSPRGRSARGAFVALVLAGSAITYMAQRLDLSISLAGLLPYSYTHDSPATGSSSALFALFVSACLVCTYMCAKEVWCANKDVGTVRTLPKDEVLLGTILLQGGTDKYDKMRKRGDIKCLREASYLPKQQDEKLYKLSGGV